MDYQGRPWSELQAVAVRQLSGIGPKGQSECLIPFLPFPPFPTLDPYPSLLVPFLRPESFFTDVQLIFPYLSPLMPFDLPPSGSFYHGPRGEKAK